MNVFERIHARFIYGRRLRVLGGYLAGWIPENANLLDVGCGDGRLTYLVCAMRPDIFARGIDVLEHPATAIPVQTFDGRTIPFPDASFDVVMLVDVLHHADDPETLLSEAGRVADTCILLKDHLLQGWLARPTLHFMDWVGNARHGVALPYNYWREERWRLAFASLSLDLSHWETKLGLYPPPVGWVFDRSLHFVARLEVRE